MKKFTTNFLSGGYRSSLRILRSVALGLVALVWANSAAFGQACPPPPSTVHFYAGEVTACYNETNLYEVNIGVEDFYNVDSLNLYLDYLESNWTFESATVLHSTFLSTDTATIDGSFRENFPMKVTDDGSVLNFSWAEWIGRGRVEPTDVTTPIVKLVFSLKNFPNNTQASYLNPLEWLVSSKVYHCNGGVTYTQWTDNTFHNGFIETDVIYDHIDLTIDPNPVDCYNSTAQVEVTFPVGTGLEYSYNGGVSWTTSPVASAFSGDHVVQVKDGNGCLSVREKFTVDVKDALTFKTKVTDEGCGNLGNIEFVVTGGAAPFTYWVVPSAEYSQVMFTIMLNGKNDPSLDIYKFTTEQNLRPAGDYMVAVDDDNGCISLEEDYHWKGVTILPGTALVFTDTVTVDTVTCYNGNDGEYVIQTITGDSLYYTVFVENVGTGVLVANKDSVQAPDTIGGLAAGTYQTSISNGICTKTSTFTIYNTDPITFYVKYNDAPCAAATGSLWISEINGDSIKNTTLDTTGWTYQVVGGGLDTIVSISDTLFGLSADYYSAWLIPNCGKVAFDNKDGSGNTIPLLDNGNIKFDVVQKNETCFGVTDAYITVDNVRRDCGNCNDNAVYQFAVYLASDSSVVAGSEWTAITDTVLNIVQDTYMVSVRDSMDPAVCIISQQVIITGADSALIAIIDSIHAPTCKGGNDGWVKMYVSGGIPPYEYSVDNAPNWRPTPSFGLTEGDHLLQVRDVNGCIWDSTITVVTLDPLLIAATPDTVQCNGDMVAIDVAIGSYTWYSDSSVYSYFYTEVSSPEGFVGTNFEPAWATTPTTFHPGTYFVKAKDPNGCWSQEVEILIDGLQELIIDTLIVEDAKCYGTWSGKVTLTVLQGNPDSVYYYTYANNYDYLINPGANLTWYPFTVGDTVVTESFLKGTYWFMVKDACEESDPVRADVDGYDPIVITEVEVDDVICFGGDDGKITVTAAGGAPGAGVGNYLYTLKLDGIVIGTEMQTSNEFSGLVATNTGGSYGYSRYTVLVYDTTDPNATPSMCVPDSQYVMVNQPLQLGDKIGISHVTCADAEDGVIHVSIHGGVGGSYNYNGFVPFRVTPLGRECVNNCDGKSYKVTINGITGDRDYSLELDDDQNEVDFQVYGGMFEVVVEDANGCMIIDTVTVLEPEPWVINTWYEDPSDCNIKDGKIWASATGGYDAPYDELYFMLDGASTMAIYPGDTILLSDTAIYNVDYVVTVVNENPPYTGGVPPCPGVDTVNISVNNPFEFDVDVECVLCHGDSTGTVTLSNITGGSGAYQIQLVGGLNPSYDAGNDDLWWPVDTLGAPDYVSTDIVFDTLSAGDYWIYLRDDSGFTLANCCRPIKFTMCEPDSLELISVMLVNDVACAGDSTGAFSIQAMGGIPPYEYTYTRTELSDIGFPYPGIPVDAVWSTDSIISNLPSGLYVGWVKDANGCISGCEINSAGAPIDDHRVAIREAGAIVFDSYSVFEPACFGGLADIRIYNVTGGSGDSITFKATGATYMGMDTVYVFAPMLRVDGGTYLLQDVLASNNDGYVISAMTSENCDATGDSIYVAQPDEFAVNIDITSGAICHGDKEVLIVLSTTGGSGDVTYDIWKDDELIREDSDIPNHVVAVGAVYTVIATDERNCMAVDSMDIQIPEHVTFEIKDVSCNGETLASAMVIAKGTPGRQFTVWYQYFEGGVVDPWKQYNGEFTDTITMLETFIYDDENLDDVHYAFKILDDNGCESGIDTLTFDKVQHPIEVYIDEIAQNECSAEILLHVTGGIDPYVVVLDGDTITDMAMTLSSGMHTVVVNDTHLRCILNHEFEVMGNPVVRDTTITTFIDQKTQFVDAEAGVDTMLAGGMHTFIYMDTTAMCDRTLNVDVEEIPQTLLISQIQGNMEESPIIGQIAKTSGTVSTVVSGEGFFMQDENAAWSGIWIEYSAVDADGIIEGNGIEVVGKVAEIANVTSLIPSEVTTIPATLVVEAVVLNTPVEVNEERFESVLVQVVGARAMDYDSPTGEWTIMYTSGDEATVNNWLFDPTVTVEAFYNVTGIVNGRLDNYKLEPRMASDVVNVSDTKIGDLDGIEFKVYPNPFGDIINIVNHDKLTRVVISNIAGQRVIDIAYPNSEIRTNGLVSGVYVVSLFTESGIAKTEKIIKK